MRLGVHVSIAGKIYEAIDRAKQLGCNTIQIFSRSPREWRNTRLNTEDIKEFRQRREKAKIYPLFIHVPYLTNLASPFKKLYQASIKYYIEYLKEAEILGAEYLVSHMGSHKKSGERVGIKRFSQALNIIFQKTKGLKVILLLENTSGSGSWLGYKFQHQQKIINNIQEQKRIGICFDTCHGFSAGYDIATKDGLDKTLDEMDKLIGLKWLKLIHLNDSKDKLGSLRDRHEHIGKGKIGIGGFRNIVNYPKFRDLPFILETPKTTESDDKRNLAIIRQLIKKEVC
ncbi:MAG: deoxyribonuclease IV [Candidatus Omnitrophota bacterium]|nr:deoxyribonuclease IV [Candidatus Omnitrophota bacterium]